MVDDIEIKVSGTSRHSIPAADLKLYQEVLNPLIEKYLEILKDEKPNEYAKVVENIKEKGFFDVQVTSDTRSYEEQYYVMNRLIKDRTYSDIYKGKIGQEFKSKYDGLVADGKSADEIRTEMVAYLKGDGRKVSDHMGVKGSALDLRVNGAEGATAIDQDILAKASEVMGMKFHKSDDHFHLSPGGYNVHAAYAVVNREDELEGFSEADLEQFHGDGDDHHHEIEATSTQILADNPIAESQQAEQKKGLLGQIAGFLGLDKLFQTKPIKAALLAIGSLFAGAGAISHVAANESTKADAEANTGRITADDHARSLIEIPTGKREIYAQNAQDKPTDEIINVAKSQPLVSSGVTQKPLYDEHSPKSPGVGGSGTNDPSQYIG